MFVLCVASDEQRSLLHGNYSMESTVCSPHQLAGCSLRALERTEAHHTFAHTEEAAVCGTNSASS